MILVHTLYDIQLCVEILISHSTLCGLEIIIFDVPIKIWFVHHREHCVSIRKTKDVCYGHHAEQGNVLMDKMQGF